jgi:hypothetical protein
MGDAGRLGDLDRLQLDLPGAVLVEQPDAVTEQDRDEMELYLVQQPGLDELLRGARAAQYRDRLSPAAACACSRAWSALPVTKVKVADPFMIGARGSWVRTKHGLPLRPARPHPVVEALTAVAHRLIDADVRAGHEAVQ